MLRKASTKKRRWILAPVAGVVTAAIVAGVVYDSSEVASARISLPGIEEITQSNSYSDPFTILEIVPSYDKAKLGYLVNGEEPAYYDSEKGVLALADMGSTEERADRFHPNSTDPYYVAANNGFDAFEKLKGKAFLWAGDFLESDTGAVAFDVHGSFVEKDASASGADYVDARTLAGSFKEVEDPNDATSKFTLKQILNAVNTETTGEVYDDEVVYEFGTPINEPYDPGTAEYILDFSAVKDATAPEAYPFGLDVESTGVMYFDWSYYRPTVIKLSQEPMESNPSIMEYKLSLPLEQFRPIFIDEDGPNNDGVYDNMQYLGFVYYSDAYGEWCYYDAIRDQGYTNLESQSILKAIYDDYYDPSTGIYKDKPDAVCFTMDEFVSWSLGEEETLPDDLYYVSGITHDARNGFASYSLIDKNLRIVKGQDPTVYGLDINDPLTYHKYFYLENKPDAEFAYTTTKTKGTHNFISDYTGEIADSFLYDGGFMNEELFKKYVLDRDPGAECSDTVVNVVTKLYEDVTPEDVQNADLIYINGQGTPSGDMNIFAAQEIVQSVKSFKAIVIEAEALYDQVADDAGDLKNGQDNNANLAVSLAQSTLGDGDIDRFVKNWDYKSIYDKRSKTGGYVKGSVFVTPSTDTTYVDVITDSDSSDALLFTKTITGDTNLAGYQDVVEDIKTEVWHLKNAYGEQGYKSLRFNEEVSFATIFRHILSYGKRRVTTKDTYNVLDIEPFYSEEFEKNKSLFGDKFRDRSGEYTDSNAKNATRNIFDAAWFKKNICESDNPPTINVTGMGTREFVGNITDLNGSYDLIYIGLDTLYMNTERITSGDWWNQTNTKSTKTVYNDSRLDGLIYSHVGDKMTFSSGNDANASGSYRMGGNDITYEKLKDLETYVEAGYAVLLSNDFFTYSSDGKINGINKKLIDENSYMYDFAKLCLYGVRYLDSNGEVQDVDIDVAMRSNDYTHGYIGKNVNVVKDFDKTKTYSNGDESKLAHGKTFASNKEEFVKYLNLQKLEINEISRPVEYYNAADKTAKHYLASRNGGYYLDFEVELLNKAATGSPSYDCKLYIDVEADGRYEELDVQPVDAITTTDGTSVYKRSDGKYALSTGVRYQISKKVPEDFKGFISWKLEFVENDRKSSSGEDLVKSSIVGYSAVPNNNEKETIHVLQIVSGGNKGTNLDLTEKNMTDLYAEVQDFNIDVKKITGEEFVNNVANNEKLQYLENYQMIVMGFADVYELPFDWSKEQNSYEAVYALREYILSGRSMLFTHDLNSPHTDFASKKSEKWGAFLNQFIRELQGMDRYGATKDHVKELEDKVGKTCTEYESRYDNDDYLDIWGQPSTKVTNSRFSINANSWDGNYVDKVGLIYGLFAKYRDGNDNVGDVSKSSLRSLTQSENYGANNDKPIKDTENNYTSTKVRMVNEGQITDYPFHIGESLDVATTHPQYFQLNLDTDSKDSNFDDDIVVWYAIDGYASGKNSQYFSMDQNDVRNNYYIYNKGNITYTGSGHALIKENQSMERKLFVNTLVAAYSAGKHAPNITFKESPWNLSADIKAIYEPYDVSYKATETSKEGGAILPKISANFKVSNNSLKGNVDFNEETGEVTYKPINVRYYVQDPSGEYTIDGTKYKMINAADIDLKMMVDSAGNKIANPSSLTDIYTLDNFAIYTAEIKNSYFLNMKDNGDDKLELAKHSVKLYIRASMEPIDDNEKVVKLPGTESMNPLEINFTELYELK